MGIGLRVHLFKLFFIALYNRLVFESTKECKGLRRNCSSFLIVKTMYYVKVCGTWCVVRGTWYVVRGVVSELSEFALLTLYRLQRLGKPLVDCYII